MGKTMEIVLVVLLIIVVLGSVFFSLLARFAVRPTVWPLEETKNYLINILIMEC